MLEFWKLDLQLFGEGAAAGGDGGATGDGGAEGAAAADAGQQMDYESKLKALGVPESKIRKRAKQQSAVQTQAQSTQPQEAEGQAAAAEPAQDDTQGSQQADRRLSWDEIMQDPEYNGQMQKVIQARLKASKSAQDALGKLTPALELLGAQYGIDVSDVATLDAEALANAVVNDKRYYQAKADELGTSIETAMRVDRMERDTARRQKQDQLAFEQQKVREHFVKLQQQGEALKKTFPTFDLQTELNNPVFARMTSPGVGLSVEDAYYAVHRQQLQAASMQVAAQKTAEKLSNAIASGSHRPVENGMASKAASVAQFDYKSLTRQQREDFKKQIRTAAARGEKIYPNGR